MVKGRVLVIDDEKNITFVVQAVLERVGFEVISYNDPAEALENIELEDVDVVVTDLYMPGVGGMEILAYCQSHFPQLPVVVITAHGTVESAVTALKKGAFDYITKPFEQTELVNVIQKAAATHQQTQNEPATLFGSPVEMEEMQTAQGSGAPIIGVSQEIQELYKMIGKIARSPSTVLIWGESGTGKELVASEIHRKSDRADKPFIKMNCAAIPATLIESELFGFEKGAFTGAVASKPGRFELAHEGTLFLDEVADMPLEMQVKLLRVLQEHEFERVGGITSLQVDVRIIAATNKDLEEQVKLGHFREDLFYRLNVVPIYLPALRDRKEDIDLLVRYFIKQFNLKLKKQITGISEDAQKCLRAQNWPGNIRQLENVLERMVLMCEGTQLTVLDLPEEFDPSWNAQMNAPKSTDSEAIVTGDFIEDPSAEGGLKEIVKRQTQTLERSLIEKALEETGGNVTRAAEKLGLSRKGLQLKIKELGLARR